MAGPGKVQVQQAKLLIVEGIDEVGFFEAALPNHPPLSEIQVLPIGGKTKLSQNLAALKNDAAFPSVRCLAIVRDADLTTPGAPNTAASQRLLRFRDH